MQITTSGDSINCSTSDTKSCSDGPTIVSLQIQWTKLVSSLVQHFQKYSLNLKTVLNGIRDLRVMTILGHLIDQRQMMAAVTKMRLSSRVYRVHFGRMTLTSTCGTLLMRVKSSGKQTGSYREQNGYLWCIDLRCTVNQSKNSRI